MMKTVSRLVLGLALGCQAGCFHARPEARQDAQAASPAQHFSTPFISPGALKARLAKGEAIEVVDVRSRPAFEAEHVRGAVDRPKIDLVDGQPAMPTDRPVALYCDCPDDQSSITTAVLLHERRGHTNLLVIKGGLAALKAAGFPMAVATAASP